MTITPSASLASIVTEHPELARELERHDLDYCCGGSATLDEACRAKGLDAARVVAELAARAERAGPAPWATMGPADLVDHIEATHHAYLHAELPRLGVLADKVLAAHGGRHPELAGIRDVFTSLRADLEPHLAKEELVLFPMIRRLAGRPTTEPVVGPPSVRQPIAVMVTEHDHAGMLLEHLRDRTRGFEAPADGCASYAALYAGFAELEADTHLHVHKENNLLFPAVLALEGA
jgi:regulator of cell morphogenesis and NO signaling